MNPEKDILSKVNHNDGMTVPENYFEDFAARMCAALPEQTPEIVRPRGVWQRVRPYVYMAAMFAGVWCMLKMFSIMSGTPVNIPMEANPVMAEAFGNDAFVNEYVMNDLNQWDIYDEMMDDGVDAEAFTDSLLQNIQFD